MYKSPIELIYKDAQYRMEKDIFYAIQKVDIKVDRDELLKALAYDRGQYEKGYEDAKAERKKGEWTTHEVACLLAEVMGDDCACNVNGNDEWLPFVCEFAETTCPNVVGVACWEQWLVHRKKETDG